MIMNAQMTCCHHSYKYKLIFPEAQVSANQILQTHIEDPMLHKVSLVPCCKDCCVEERDSSVLYKVIYVEENQQDNVLRIIENELKGDKGDREIEREPQSN